MHSRYDALHLGVEMMLSLKDAIAQGRLGDFVNQAEAAGVGPANEADVEAALERLIRQPRSEDRTSRSPSDDGSSGT